MDDVNVKMKRCYDCKTWLTLDSFWTDRHRPDKKMGRCKRCAKARQQKYWKEVYYPQNRLKIIETVTNQRKQAQHVAGCRKSSS